MANLTGNNDAFVSTKMKHASTEKQFLFFTPLGLPLSIMQEQMHQSLVHLTIYFSFSFAAPPIKVPIVCLEPTDRACPAVPAPALFATLKQAFRQSGEPYAVTSGTYWFGERSTGDPEKGDRPLLYSHGARRAMMKAGTIVSAMSGIPLVLANRFPEEGQCDPARAFPCALLLLWVFCSSSQRRVCSLGLPHPHP